MRPSERPREEAIEEFIKIATSLGSERDLNRLLDMLVTSARKLAGAEAGWVLVLDATNRHLHPAVEQDDRVSDPAARLAPAALFIDGRRNMKQVCAFCTFTGEITSIPDVYAYTGFDFQVLYDYDRANRCRTRSIVAVPLRDHEESTIGVLLLANRCDPASGRIREFPPDLHGLIVAFASQAAVAINNVKLITQNERLIRILNSTNAALQQENQELRSKIVRRECFSSIIGEAPAVRRVLDLLDRIIDTDATVLIGGETGTGKELVARTLHDGVAGARGEFVAQNCAALPETLLESELFGFKRGAFSGATMDKMGLFELADRGTLFLDEIGDMPIGLQAKLLRVLQEGEVRPLGSVQSRKVDVRVVAATHCDLREKVRAGLFREDLYYRLCVFPIVLPSLRERSEDIPALLSHFLGEVCRRYGKSVSGFSLGAVDHLMSYDYPGNIRELRNVVERALLLCDEGGTIVEHHLPPHIAQGRRKAFSLEEAETGDLRRDVGRFEASLIARKLDTVNWNQTRAAQELGISRRTLIEKIVRYGLRRGGETRLCEMLHSS